MRPAANTGDVMTDIDLLEERRRVARQVDAALADHPAVVAVLVFGSVATGYVDAHSDVDILAVCHTAPLTLAERQELLAPLGSGWHWQDTTDDNALFAEVDSDGDIGGILVSMHYQTASWITAVLHAVLLEGAITTPQLPFRPYTLPALLLRAWVLSDHHGLIRQWQAQAQAFPALLKAHLLRQWGPLLSSYVTELTEAAHRGFGPRVFLFFLDRALDAFLSLLYALNDLYDPADKRAERTILPTLPLLPNNFLARWAMVVHGPFDDAGQRERASILASLVADVLVLVDNANLR